MNKGRRGKCEAVFTGKPTSCQRGNVRNGAWPSNCPSDWQLFVLRSYTGCRVSAACLAVVLPGLLKSSTHYFQHSLGKPSRTVLHIVHDGIVWKALLGNNNCIRQSTLCL